MIESKYDEFSVLKTQPWKNIKKGDPVKFNTTILIKVGDRKQAKKVVLRGIWDGEKVAFNDENRTVVRTTRWLEKAPFKKKELLKLRLPFKFGDIEMIDSFSIRETDEVVCIESNLSHIEGKIKSPYHYYSCSIGLKAKKLALKQFSEWFSNLKIK